MALVDSGDRCFAVSVALVANDMLLTDAAVGVCSWVCTTCLTIGAELRECGTPVNFSFYD